MKMISSAAAFVHGTAQGRTQLFHVHLPFGEDVRHECAKLLHLLCEKIRRRQVHAPLAVSRLSTRSPLSWRTSFRLLCSLVDIPTLKRLLARLRQLRERHELLQESFSELSGISYNWYQAVEAGRKRELRLSTLEKFARAHGLEPWQLSHRSFLPSNPPRAMGSGDAGRAAPEA